MSTTTLLPRHRRIELLAASEPDPLVELAERCLIETSAPKLVARPDVGLLIYQVREPVENERFYLGEILVSRAEPKPSRTPRSPMPCSRDRKTDPRQPDDESSC